MSEQNNEQNILIGKTSSEQYNCFINHVPPPLEVGEGGVLLTTTRDIIVKCDPSYIASVLDKMPKDAMFDEKVYNFFLAEIHSLQNKLREVIDERDRWHDICKVLSGCDDVKLLSVEKIVALRRLLDKMDASPSNVPNIRLNTLEESGLMYGLLKNDKS